jgi:hypothetical protein
MSRGEEEEGGKNNIRRVIVREADRIIMKRKPTEEDPTLERIRLLHYMLT